MFYPPTNPKSTRLESRSHTYSTRHHENPTQSNEDSRGVAWVKDPRPSSSRLACHLFWLLRLIELAQSPEGYYWGNALIATPPPPFVPTSLFPRKDLASPNPSSQGRTGEDVTNEVPLQIDAPLAPRSNLDDRALMRPRRRLGAARVARPKHPCKQHP